MTRFSKQREAVRDAVMNTSAHPNADAVYTKVKQALPKISMGTVYRNLKSLTESGDITTVETTSAELRYDGNTDNHAHFICLDCGKIFDVEDDADRYTHLNESGFKVERLKCVLYGLCPECGKNKN